MKVLITGANGYIGSKVTKKLCDLNVEVVATDFCNDNIDKRAKYVKSDVFTHCDNWFAFFGDPDICLHLAYRDGFVHNSDKHLNDLPLHYAFLTNLIDNGLKKLAIMGTMHEVGYHIGSINEDTICKPLSLYGIAKHALRLSMEVYSKSKHIKLQWLRAFYIYGDDLFGNSIFSKLKRAVNEGKKTFPFTSGEKKYDFIYVNDLVDQIVKTILQDKVLGIINVCSGVPETLKSKVEWYLKWQNLPIKLEYGRYEDRSYDSPCIYGDDTKIKMILKEFD